MEDPQNITKGKAYRSYAIPRMIAACAVMIMLVWALAVGLGVLDQPGGQPSAGDSPEKRAVSTTGDHSDTKAAGTHAAVSQKEHAPTPSSPQAAGAAATNHQPSATSEQSAKTTDAPHQQTAHEKPSSEAAGTKTDTTHPEAAAREQVPVHKPTGVAFVEATIRPIEHELKKRFWGWRPNDIINITDNVNSFQLGVLEVTRRTAVQLAERISRTGTTDSFNPHLENAMNWFMVKANRYWFPSPEAKYKESLEELAAYRDELLQHNASFYTRTDNLIPLLAAFEDLLGSCDENLVKSQEMDATEVSYFKVDDYFYYAKGVASAMATILEAVHHDFDATLAGRHGTELLHHAIVSCQRAGALSPWLITDGDLDGIFANHRANMAAPISHARFYLGQLVKTLST